MTRTEQKHNTAGITLEQFIALKPEELRLGQWFVNCYCKTVPLVNGWHWDMASDKLWNLDGSHAVAAITNLMWLWQWETLPEIN